MVKNSLVETPSESVELLRTLDAGLRAAGMDADAVLRRIGVSRSDLIRRNSRTPLSARAMYFDAVSEVTGLADPVPLLSRHIPLPGRFVLVYLLLSSDTLREGWMRISRHLRLVSDALDGTLNEEGDIARCVIATGPPHDHGDLAGERLMARGLQMVWQSVVPSLTPISVELRGPAPANRADYESIYGCAVSFERETSSLGIKRSVLDMPSPFADELLMRVHLVEADAALVALSHRDTINRIRKFVAQRLETGAPSQDETADALGLTQRQLRHHLSLAGTNYSTVIDKLRRDMSTRLLADREIDLAQISYIVGFSEQSAFQRAFRRWTGTTPLAWRQGRVCSDLASHLQNAVPATVETNG